MDDKQFKLENSIASMEASIDCAKTFFKGFFQDGFPDVYEGMGSVGFSAGAASTSLILDMITEQFNKMRNAAYSLLDCINNQTPNAQ